MIRLKSTPVWWGKRSGLEATFAATERVVTLAKHAPGNYLLLLPFPPLSWISIANGVNRLRRCTWLLIAVGSVAVHIVGIALFLALPEVVRSPDATVITPDLSKAVHIYAPQIFRADADRAQSRQSLARARRAQCQPCAAAASAAFSSAAARARTGGRSPAQPAPVPEAPKMSSRKSSRRKMEAAAPPPQPPAIRTNPPADTPPPPTAPAKPKLAFESISAGQTAYGAESRFGGSRSAQPFHEPRSATLRQARAGPS